MRRFVKIWKGDFMQDYEELYREARRKYDYACDQINAYNGLIAGAQEQRKNKVNRINELNGSTKKIRAAIDDLKEVLKREEKVTEKYKKVVKEIDAASDNFSSMVDDSEVSNKSLNDVFSAEASGTKSAIENVFQTVRERKGTLESNLEEQKQELQRAKEDLSDIDSNIRYYKNQPWGMSGSLLTGFFADLDGDDTIRLDETELSTADWFRYDEMPAKDDGVSLTREMIRVFTEQRNI